MVTIPVSRATSVAAPTQQGAGSGSRVADAGGFLSTMHNALANISTDQTAAAGAEKAVAEGKPGASMSTALVLSDRAQLAFNAAVSVRDEVVSAYQNLMSMQI